MPVNGSELPVYHLKLIGPEPQGSATRRKPSCELIDNNQLSLTDGFHIKIPVHGAMDSGIMFKSMFKCNCCI